MKQLIIIVATVILCISLNTAKAQNSLEFERSIFIELGGTFPNSMSITIPAGKTWKITSAVASSQNAVLSLNDKTIYYNNNTSINAMFPIWLPSGTYIIQVGVGRAFVSGIEFNIVP